MAGYRERKSPLVQRIWSSPGVFYAAVVVGALASFNGTEDKASAVRHSSYMNSCLLTAAALRGPKRHPGALLASPDTGTSGPSSDLRTAGVTPPSKSLRVWQLAIFAQVRFTVGKLVAVMLPRLAPESALGQPITEPIELIFAHLSPISRPSLAHFAHFAHLIGNCYQLSIITTGPPLKRTHLARPQLTSQTKPPASPPAIQQLPTSYPPATHQLITN
ncbi:hypothetical protein AOQ84DRAFT_230423 [Glonium stellatum]|uniref:Uncharacterized protein n=1 Tax=Glonium stellatum TaxID=574774 RepID=A0A8E2F5B0_9PEZI|nr:hypothetical protein AOQ84DRAFT_230423 [Glonium stellatum]